MIRPRLTSLGCPRVLGHTHTHTHCQIVAQLKLRILLTCLHKGLALLRTVSSCIDIVYVFNFRNDPPSQSTIIVTQDLLNMAYDWQSTTSSSPMPRLDPIKDMKMTDIEFVDQTKRVQLLEKQLSSFQCLKCKEINEHV